MVVVVVVTLQPPRMEETVVRVVVLVRPVMVRVLKTLLVLVQLDLHAKGMMVVLQTVVMQERPVVVAPVVLVGIAQVVALLLVQVV